MIALLVSTFLGVLSACGIGGGSLLSLWLTLVMKYPASQARVINLLTYIFSASTISLIRRIKGHLSIKDSAIAIISGCISAAALSFISHSWPVETLRRFFGAFLIIISFREIKYKNKQSHR